MKTLREEAITQMIQAKLNENKNTSGQTIDVSVTESEVFLVGWCDYEEQKAVAEQIVRGTYGVRAVVDRVRVRRFRQSI